MTREPLGVSLDRVIHDSRFSGVALVSWKDRLLYQRAQGFADRARGIPANGDTQFATASVTKGLTALAVLSLVADGSLALDTSVRDVLGDALDFVDPAVTVVHLLAHTSGIGDYFDESDTTDIEDHVLRYP